MLPFLAALVIGLSAQPFQWIQTYHMIEQARSQNDLVSEARGLAQIAAWQVWRGGLWEEAGIKALRGGAPLDAIRYLTTGQSGKGLSEQGYLALASAYEQTNQVSLAEQAWLALSRHPNPPPDVFESLTLFYWRNDRLDEAFTTAQTWVRLAPNNPQGLYLLGLLTLEQQPAEGMALVARASQMDGGIAKRASGLTAAWTAAQKEPNAAFQMVMLGRVLGNQGDWPLAERLFARATSLAPDYAEAWAFLGEARQQLGGDGYAELEKARALNPQSVVTQALTALYYRRKGQYEESLALLKAVARQEPKQPVWQIELGNTMVEMKNIGSALEYYQSAARIDPTNPLYWRLLAEFCVIHQVSLREVGLPAARQALALTPTDPAALDVMGQVMAGLEDLASAERFLLGALEVDATFSAAHFHLGQVYLQLSQMAQAQAHLQAAYQNAPEGSGIRGLAQRLLERFFNAQP